MIPTALKQKDQASTTVRINIKLEDDISIIPASGIQIEELDVWVETIGLKRKRDTCSTLIVKENDLQWLTGEKREAELTYYKGEEYVDWEKFWKHVLKKKPNLCIKRSGCVLGVGSMGSMGSEYID